MGSSIVGDSRGKFGALVLLPAVLSWLIWRLASFQPEFDLEKQILPLVSSYAGAENVTEISQNKILRGRHVVVTGAYSGIGLGITDVFIRMGATVTAIGRSRAKLDGLQQTYGPRIITVVADLADLDQVGEAAEQILNLTEIIDIFVANAGIHYYGRGTAGETPQGFDSCFGVNYLSHALLIEKIIPALERSSHPVVASISSVMHWVVDGKDLAAPTEPGTRNSVQGEQYIVKTKDPVASRPTKTGDLHFWLGQWSYANSKLAQILFSKAAARRHQKVRFVSVCPGWVLTSISKGNLFHYAVQIVAFRYNGWGISSALRAVFDFTNENDYFINSEVSDTFMRVMFQENLAPLVLPSNHRFLRFIGEFVSTGLGTAVAVFQKLTPKVRGAESSLVSMNETLQEELYGWTMNTLSGWL